MMKVREIPILTPLGWRKLVRIITDVHSGGPGTVAHNRLIRKLSFNESVV